MAFRSRATDPLGGGGPGTAAADPRVAGQPCGGLARILSRAFKEPKPDILVLGPLCGDSVVYLAGRGARAHVEPVDLPPPFPPKRPGETPLETLPFRFELPDQAFHLVLAWEMLDFVPPDRLTEVGAELRRILRDGGWIFCFSHQKPAAESETIPRYRVLADDLIAREDGSGPRHRRYVHPTREIERALAGFSIQGIQLQRSQMREIVAFKPGVG